MHLQQQESGTALQPSKPEGLNCAYRADSARGHPSCTHNIALLGPACIHNCMLLCIAQRRSHHKQTHLSSMLWRPDLMETFVYSPKNISSQANASQLHALETRPYGN
eukprot:1161737-Pelagomonas_calceolata.AAC.3